MRSIRWPFWAALGALAAVWVVLGFTLPHTIDVNDIFNVASLAAFGTALAFIVIYTTAGLLGRTKWWTNNIGSCLILAATAVLFIAGPTAFAVLFHHGVIDTWAWAWAYIGGHVLSAATWGGLCLLLIRNPGNGKVTSR